MSYPLFFFKDNPPSNEYTQGMTISVKNVDVKSPPITTAPSGCRASPPSPNPRAIGSIPNIVVRDVIRMGRSLLNPPEIIASVFSASSTGEKGINSGVT